MTTHAIDVPDKLVPVFQGPARYRGAYGGRGSGKTRTFAKMAATVGLKAAKAGQEGIILCCRAFMNSLDESSLSEVKAAISSDRWLSSHYVVTEKTVTTTCGRVAFKFGGLMRNVESIKSKARILLCWVDEAEEVPDVSWVALVPTVREDESEIWVTWNPKRKGSATDKRFRNNQAHDVKIVEINWRDNPWFPAVLERERQATLLEQPDQYAHIWDGDYATAATGAYYAQQLLVAKQQGRITQIGADPLLPLRSYHDIGGQGANADAYAIWIAQFVGPGIRILDHYETIGQPIAAHVLWMRQNGYAGAEIVLPHDGANEGGPAGSWASHWRAAGFSTRIVPNQGRGAAGIRIEACRRWFPRMWFNDGTTEHGRISLGMYAPKFNSNGADMGPNHEHSHSADAFGLMACDYREPNTQRDARSKPVKRSGTAL